MRSAALRTPVPRESESSFIRFRRQTRQFTRVHTLEVLRNPGSLATLLLSFVGLIGLLWGVDLLISSAVGESVGLLAGSLPLIALTGLMANAFMLTTVPLVRHRGSGVLRLIATTPAHRAAYLLGHAPVRIAVLAVQVLTVVAVWRLTVRSGTGVPGSGNSVSGIQAAAAIPTLVLGGFMLLALGYLLGARLSSTETAMQLSYIIPVAVLATSGTLFPLEVLPGWAASALRVLPTTWLGETLGAAFSGAQPHTPAPLAWALMAVVCVTASCAAVRYYRWERSKT